MPLLRLVFTAVGIAFLLVCYGTDRGRQRISNRVIG